MFGLSRVIDKFLVVALRPSQAPGRTYATGFLDNQSSGGTVYTVTAGKRLYVKTIVMSSYNLSAVAAASIQVRDNTTVRMPISTPAAGVGALSSAIISTVTNLNFQEPLQFSTNFNVNIAAGTVTYSISFTGYEETP